MFDFYLLCWPFRRNSFPLSGSYHRSYRSLSTVTRISVECIWVRSQPLLRYSHKFRVQLRRKLFRNSMLAHTSCLRVHHVFKLFLLPFQFHKIIQIIFSTSFFVLRYFISWCGYCIQPIFFWSATKIVVFSKISMMLCIVVVYNVISTKCTLEKVILV